LLLLIGKKPPNPAQECGPDFELCELRPIKTFSAIR